MLVSSFILARTFSGPSQEPCFGCIFDAVTLPWRRDDRTVSWMVVMMMMLIIIIIIIIIIMIINAIFELIMEVTVKVTGLRVVYSVIQFFET